MNSISNGCRGALSLIVAAIVLAGCSRAAAGDGCAADGEPAVRNQGEGAWTRDGLSPRLVELWRAGDVDGPLRMEFPAAIAAAPDGRVAVADFHQNSVLVFGSDGSSVQSWPIDGHPDVPVAVSWTRDGFLLIFDLGASRLLLADSSGALRATTPISPTFLEKAVAGGGLDWAGVLPGGTVLFQPLAELDEEAADPAASVWSIWRQRSGAERIDTVMIAPARLFGYTLRARTPVPAWPRLRAAVGGAGLLAVGGDEPVYRVRFFDEEGRHVRTVCRDAAPVPLSARETGEEPGLGELEREILRDAPRPRVPAHFGHFFVGAGGELWVQRERPMTLARDPLASVHGEPGGRYDVFDPEGLFLGEVRAPEGIRLRAAAGDRVLGLHADPDGSLRLVALRLTTEPAPDT